MDRGPRRGRGQITDVLRDIGQTGTGECINLRITNETEYRAWNTKINGVKVTGPSLSGYFGVINLMAPRSPHLQGPKYVWHTSFTFVQLKFEFRSGGDGSHDHARCVESRLDLPLLIDRVFMTFYDPDGEELPPYGGSAGGMAQVTASAQPANIEARSDGVLLSPQGLLYSSSNTFSFAR